MFLHDSSAKQAGHASWFRVCPAIAKVTFQELVRDRVLYNILLFALLLFGIGLLASGLTFIQPERVVLDFGLAAVAISSGMIGIFCGAGILIREFERRTIAVALSRPISRGQFVVGKYLGLACVLTVNWALMAAVQCGMLALHGDAGTGAMSSTYFIALGLALIQSYVLAGLAILFSTFSTVSLSVIMTIGLYLIGTNVSSMRAAAEKGGASAPSALLKAFAAVVPNFENFSLGTRVTYGLPVEGSYVIMTLGYSLTMIAFYLLLAGVLVRMRES